jgi:hypothetical protein
MQYCLLMHYQGGPEIGLTEEDMAPARAAFARYATPAAKAGTHLSEAQTRVAELVGASYGRPAELAQ